MSSFDEYANKYETARMERRIARHQSASESPTAS
jgi:hypothetical protein